MIQTTKQFEAVCNFRDLGGIRTADGRTVRHRQLYRSGEIGYATIHDKMMLEKLELKTILDYRDLAETFVYPPPTLDGTELLQISATTNASLHVNPSVDDTTCITVDNFIEACAQLPFHNPAYRALMDRIVHRDVPLLQFCTAGKDRTGIGVALVYLLLGVDEETIVADFLQTNQAIAEKKPLWYTHWQHTLSSIEHGETLLYANERALREAFCRIRKTYGNYERYFYEEFNISTDMRTHVQQYYLK
ncbi:tyrosine-protein phosphatase [Caryophanon tenue]|uniref:Protein tyrosine phosphatase n=1 Tax=Caryophanon tenue TaxID=33978 RepID=A0A1C0Y6S7_9BACL|nr:tyrosine-protein phosphatase [Caryophanon tenue]OCS82887.1 hypothetical protein A6M13_05665 [Caryophanon tenue]